MTISIDHTDSTVSTRAVATVKWLAGAAAVCLATAIVAGLTMAIAEPSAGSTTEAALGLTAAVSGLGVAGFTVAALVVAQVAGLWRLAPVWVRAAGSAVLVVVVARTVRKLIGQLS